MKVYKVYYEIDEKIDDTIIVLEENQTAQQYFEGIPIKILRKEEKQLNEINVNHLTISDLFKLLEYKFKKLLAISDLFKLLEKFKNLLEEKK